MGSLALGFTGKVEQGRVTVLLETNVHIVQCDKTEVPKPFLFCQPEWVDQSPLVP